MALSDGYLGYNTVLTYDGYDIWPKEKLVHTDGYLTGAASGYIDYLTSERAPPWLADGPTNQPAISKGSEMADKTSYNLLARLFNSVWLDGAWGRGANRIKHDALSRFMFDYRDRSKEGGEILQLASQVLKEE